MESYEPFVLYELKNNLPIILRKHMTETTVENMTKIVTESAPVYKLIKTADRTKYMREYMQNRHKNDEKYEQHKQHCKKSYYKRTYKDKSDPELVEKYGIYLKDVLKIKFHLRVLMNGDLSDELKQEFLKNIGDIFSD
jgi:hypothetical protein